MLTSDLIGKKSRQDINHKYFTYFSIIHAGWIFQKFYKEEFCDINIIGRMRHCCSLLDPHILVQMEIWVRIVMPAKTVSVVGLWIKSQWSIYRDQDPEAQRPL